MPTDKELIPKAISIATTPRLYAGVQKTAARALAEGAGLKWPHDGCAANLSALLEAAGIAVPMILGAAALGNKLGGPFNSRGWIQIPVGSQVAGDVGVAYHQKSTIADHIFFVVTRVDADEMVVADNQEATPHTRFASGKAATGGTAKSPVNHFLRAPGVDMLMGGLPSATHPLVAAVQTFAAATASPAVLATSPVVAPIISGIGTIVHAAAQSEIATYDWMQRGRAPMGYIKGMAVAYARMCCKLKNGDAVAVEAAKAYSKNANVDALTHYSDIFSAAGIPGDTPEDRLRQVFVLMMGLGMRESSGRWCEGRDRSAKNTTGEKAEAGLFQTSWNARSGSKLMPKLFQDYAGHTDFLDIFKEGVVARDRDLENFGTGDGLEFQRLTKNCPDFAVEFAAVGLRNIRKHWGPINTRAAEVKRKADAMYRQVAQMVEAQGLCPI